MPVQMKKTNAKTNRSLASAVSQKKSRKKQHLGLMDNRPEKVAQQKLQHIIVEGSAHHPIQKKLNPVRQYFFPVIQRAEWYEFGAANVTPHIHAYSGGDCHLKVAGGDRYDLIKGGRRVTQASLNEAFDRVRLDYPESDNKTRVALLEKMKDLIRNERKHKNDE